MPRAGRVFGLEETEQPARLKRDAGVQRHEQDPSISSRTAALRSRPIASSRSPRSGYFRPGRGGRRSPKRARGFCIMSHSMRRSAIPGTRLRSRSTRSPFCPCLVRHLFPLRLLDVGEALLSGDDHSLFSQSRRSLSCRVRVELSHVSWHGAVPYRLLRPAAERTRRARDRAGLDRGGRDSAASMVRLSRAAAQRELTGSNHLISPSDWPMRIANTKPAPARPNPKTVSGLDIKRSGHWGARKSIVL